ncbi:hypothetical protein HYALB_00004146 [Hymenoscyphus albidus]|uniref:Protein kinase domain-containing protein n=1 Tax=Hymenoscyphus albidus TaxID=595503 RepID=A0A9N9LFI6_9HELO|nr:hypothetical protein HYALB_00004146 [Hymenoscyphus albidus]
MPLSQDVHITNKTVFAIDKKPKNAIQHQNKLIKGLVSASCGKSDAEELCPAYLPYRSLEANADEAQELEAGSCKVEDKSESSFEFIRFQELGTQSQRTWQYHRQPTPFGLLENSPNFALESYTLENFVPSYKLLSFDGCEKQSNEFFRINSYCAFYALSPRRWHRLFLSVVISRDSPYWDCLKLPIEKASNGQLSHYIRQNVENFLSADNEFHDDQHCNIQVGENMKLGRDCFPDLKIRTRKIGENMNSESIFRKLNDIGCPAYRENELVRFIGGAEGRRGERQFATYAHPFMLSEIRFGTEQPSADQLYTIQVPHCLTGNLTVAKFHGIVVSSRQRELTGYLIDSSTGTSLCGKMYELKLEDKLSWNQRESWGRNIVESVYQVHSKGFVVGTLAYDAVFHHAILINELNKAILLKFRSKFNKKGRKRGFLPPEYRNPSVKQDMINVTPQIDIFQLGMLLWILAEDEIYLTSSYLCQKVGCYSENCQKDHSDPVSLPEPPNHIPQYWKDIVAACRTPDPNRRPAAWKILQSFPPDLCSDFQGKQSRQLCAANIEDLSIFSQKPNVRAFCGFCQAETTKQTFHCDICDGGEFDMCFSCLSENKHCNNKDHFLIERREGKAMQIQTEKFYSSPGPDGMRKIMIFGGSHKAKEQ